MNPQAVQHSSTWVSFTYASFVGAVAMVVGGLAFTALAYLPERVAA